jgi:hypothetical protein
MAVITATIFIGSAHAYGGGIQPSHMIQLSENSRSSLHLTSYASNPYATSFTKPEVNEGIVVIPTGDHTVDDIFLMISTYILGKVVPRTPMHSPKRPSMTDLFDEQERRDLYRQSREALEAHHLKVVFHLLEDSELLGQIDTIESYPCDFEITTPYKKREWSVWRQKTETRTLK